ncbi:MAG TPA: DinB family protein [Myxococcaceae bacterium]|nr:DinB family protein [Myxococcaceae bacterium]
MTPEELEGAAWRLQQFPSVLRRRVAGLGEDVLRSKRSEAEFSVAENICHLRDIEREGYSVRLRRLLDEEQPLLPDIDGARLAQERGYNSQPVPGALEDFAAERMRNVGIILGLRAEQLHRTGVLQTVGEITVERLLAIMEEHDREHLQLIEELLEAAPKPSNR